MPIYEYACDSCAHQFETIQKASEAPLTECPSCGQSALRKLLSAAAFRLKGSGWYETDFKNKNKKNLVGETAPGESSGDSASDSAGGDASGEASGGDSKSSKESSSESSKPAAAADGTSSKSSSSNASSEGA